MIKFKQILKEMTYGGYDIMNVLFLEYPKCTTCKKAKNWLTESGVEFTPRDIVKENPSKEEIKAWYEKSGLPLKRFFNTSGLVYKDLGLKDKLADMSEEEQIEILASNGMVVKRPLIVADDFVLIGFKQPQWEEKLK